MRAKGKLTKLGIDRNFLSKLAILCGFFSRIEIGEHPYKVKVIAPLIVKFCKKFWIFAHFRAALLHKRSDSSIIKLIEGKKSVKFCKVIFMFIFPSFSKLERFSF